LSGACIRLRGLFRAGTNSASSSARHSKAKHKYIVLRCVKLTGHNQALLCPYSFDRILSVC
jgi:hypothetical protein